MAKRELTYAEAIYEATEQCMAEDPSVFIFGLGVDDPIGMYGTTLDLHKKFGKLRNFDTPLSEDAMTGVAIGAALNGMRPIHVHQRMDFLLLCMNQMVNLAAKMRYSFGGHFQVPMVVRGIIGRSWGQGAQHSQAFHSYFMHVPGIKVLAPVTPHDAKGCFTAAIKDNNPVVIMEHRMLYKNVGMVPEENYSLPFGQARILTDGNDITIVAISHMVVEAVRASHLLKEVGINATVIDPVSLSPLDGDTLFNACRSTGNLLIVDHSWVGTGASAEIAAVVAERMDGNTPIKITRMGYAACPCPTTKPLENIFYPNSQSIAIRAYNMLTGKSDWAPEIKEAKEIAEFKGPF